MPLVYYFSENHPANDTDIVGGDIGSYNLDTDNFFPESNTDEDTHTWYYKFFIKNEDSLTADITLSIANWLIRNANTTLQLQFSSATDGGKIARIVSYDTTNSEWVIEDITLPTDSDTVNSSQSHDQLYYIEILEESGGEYIPSTLASPMTIVDADNTSNQLGYIPSSQGICTSYFTFNADSTANNTDTSANRLTPPTGRSFDNTSEYSNTLNTDEYWGIWLAKETVHLMPLPLHDDDAFSLELEVVWS